MDGEKSSALYQLTAHFEGFMAALLEAITVKRKMYFEFENAPYYCIDAEVSTPTARGGQTLVRLKMRNLLTQAVFDKTFKAQEKFKEPDLETVEASYLYSDLDWGHDCERAGLPGGRRNCEAEQV
jgi:elongation factor P